MFEIDTSELKGRKFRCIDGCGLCCLCQPELLQPELRTFRQDPLLSRTVVSSRHDTSRKAIAMLKNGGPCSLLRDRKCTIYSLRPHFCRQFPVHTHIMWRIQLTPDYSCRGIEIGGSGTEEEGFADLEAYGLRELHHYSDQKLEGEVKDAREVYSEFRKNCIDSNRWTDPAEVRRHAASLISTGYFSTVHGLGSILAAVERARENDLEVLDVLPTISSQQSLASSHRALSELTDELITVEDVEDQPIYVDRELNWNVYALSNGSVWRRHLLDGGGVRDVEKVTIDTENIAISADGESALKSYSTLTNARDGFLGFVYYLVDDADYEVDVVSTYLENMAMTQLDLLLRSSIVMPAGEGGIGRSQAMEGMVYLDMDMHDAPTIGSVI